MISITNCSSIPPNYFAEFTFKEIIKIFGNSGYMMEHRSFMSKSINYAKITFIVNFYYDVIKFKEIYDLTAYSHDRRVQNYLSSIGKIEIDDLRQLKEMIDLICEEDNETR